MNSTIRAFVSSFVCLSPLMLSEYVMARPVTLPGSGSVSQEIDASRPKPQPKRTVVPALIQQTEHPLSMPSGDALQVNAFRLIGANDLPQEDIQNVLKPYTGRALTLAQIEEAASKVTALYRERGYMMARAYVPEQDATRGTLTLQILVGTYGHVHINNHSLVNTRQLQSTFSQLKTGAPVTHDELERTMLLSSDLAGTQMPKMAVSRGEAAGSSDFNIDVDADKRLTGYILGDNQGSRYTGHNRLNAGVEINSPLGLGDKIDITGLTSENTHLLNGSLGYSLLLTNNGLKGNISVYRTRYELGQEYRDLDATGSDTGATLGLTYPLIRSQNHNLNFFGNVTAKQLVDKIDSADEETKKHAVVGVIGAENSQWGSLFERNLFTRESIHLTYGHLGFADEQQREANQQGADTDGNFYHLNADFQSNYALSDTLSFTLALNAQKALGNKNLDGSEQMSISGENAVSAYREVTSGDNALYLGSELRYQLPSVFDGLEHSVGTFAGTGWSNFENGSYTTSSSTHLSDVGIGYYASYKQTITLKMQLAHAVGPVADDVYSDGRTHLLVQAGLLF